MSISSITKYFSLVKFSHTIFAMPFALLGFFLAYKSGNYSFSWLLLVKMLLCMVFARNAAMGFNRYLDRDIDIKNPRTAEREIPKGIITAQNALFFVILNSLFFVCTTFFINNLVLWLSPIALLVVLGYSYTKRFTALCHIVLGIGLALAPIGAFLTVTGEFQLIPVIYSFVVLFWVSGFDILYALQDENFDKNEKLHSIPVLMGRRNSIVLSIVLHVFSAVGVILAGYLIKNQINIFYWIGAAVFIGLLIYQHIIVKPNDISRVNMAFTTTNGFASVIFASFAIAGMYL